MTTTDVCRLLQVSKSYIAKLALAEKIPHIRLSIVPGGKGVLRFNRDDILDWIEKQKVAAK
jgi:excisionase family DNA binding protein